jgi:DNA-binding response OmpR family regulator
MSSATLATQPSVPTTDPATTPTESRRVSGVPEGAEVRGFALYVGIDEAKAQASGIEIAELVERLKALVHDLAPDAGTHAAAAIAPIAAGGRDIDVVRTALRDPGLTRQRQAEPAAPKRRTGVVVDISRKRVLLDGEVAGLTYKEFELLQALVLREGRTVPRAEIIDVLWSAGDDDDVPNERTIDVHIRRLRSKLGDYEDIVRTVRGVGYRFDRHADVTIRQSTTPSPDVF